jgi:hypothetical protein
VQASRKKSAFDSGVAKRKPSSLTGKTVDFRLSYSRPVLVKIARFSLSSVTLFTFCNISEFAAGEDGPHFDLAPAAAKKTLGRGRSACVLANLGHSNAPCSKVQSGSVHDRRKYTTLAGTCQPIPPSCECAESVIRPLWVLPAVILRRHVSRPALRFRIIAEAVDRQRDDPTLLAVQHHGARNQVDI